MTEKELKKLAQNLRPYLVEMLREEGLSIVPTEQAVNAQQATLAHLQRQYLKRDALTLKEVIEAQLLPQGKSKRTLMRMINDGKLKEGVEAYRNSKNQWMIVTRAIKRLAPHLE